MKFLKKLKSSNFWVSMISAVVLILQAVFNVDIKTEYLNQIILGILGLLVMSGIVTDTPNGEVTVSQSLDIDKMKETLTSMFTQISATLQTDMANIVSQFEKINSIQNTTTEPQNTITQIQNIIESKNEVVANQNIANEVIEENEIVEHNKTIEASQIQLTLQEIDVPKNEL